MPLTPGEADRLLLHLQASLARVRRERGLLLNVPEARALIADAVCEWARDGLTWIDARNRAQGVLTQDEVLPEVVHALSEIRVEARFDDGTRLVIVPDPFRVNPDEEAQQETDREDQYPIGAALVISNESDTDIGISSHIHLAEVNPRLRLDRAAAFGMRAQIPTGSTAWIPAGGSSTLPIRPLAGARIVVGTTGLIDGPLDDPLVRAQALQNLRTCGYLDLVDGMPVGTIDQAQDAVAKAMRLRADAGDSDGR